MEEFKPERIDYSDEEVAYLGKLQRLATYARDQRDQNHIEFDDMDYITNYETNAKAANGYIKPRENKEDVGIVTGTTHEKGNTLLSSLLNYNLEADLTAFNDQDIPQVELGEAIQLLIKKSRELEDYNSNRALIYKELLDQGTVFVEEVWEECIKVKKEMKKLDWSEGVDPNKIKWDKKLEKSYGRCKTHLLSGLKVYLGNIREPNIANQPFMFTVSIMPYDIAKTIYEKWPRWKYVSNKIIHAFDLSKENTDVQDWSLTEIQENNVEVLKYYDKWNNEMMLMLNGVMMLPIEFPLTSISPSGEYSVAKGDGEQMPFFAYSKSIPAKTKVPQAVMDEMLKLIVLKTRKSFKPPMANNSNRILSNKIFMPGTILDGFDASKLVPIGGDTSGVTAGEFSAFQLIKQIVDEQSVSPVMSGDATGGSQTATEIMELKKQSMMKLGLVMYGVVNFERQLAWLRLYNILENWTKPIDEKVDDIRKKIKKVYRSFTTEGYFENGRKGTKMIKMMGAEEEMPDATQVMAEEEMMKKPGQEMRITYLKGEEIKNAKYFWKINITPTEKDTTELNRVLFKQFIVDTLTLFGPQSVNLDYVKQRWVVMGKEDPDKFLSKPQQQNTLTQAMGQMGGQQGGQVESQMTQALQPSKEPSLNTLVGAQ